MSPQCGVAPKQEEEFRMTTLTRADWEQRAQQLKIEGRAFINGEYTDAASGETFECLSPVDGRFLAKVASCD
ncbi:MAG: aldehyde dehydrogenase PuuC, partial [Pseudomonas sp.]|nr:aldehyde dehydrogenase PuuC [Pseudomonas sp.]